MAGRTSLMCRECGAPAGACETRFNECLAHEFEDAGYGKVHHLTVSAYMLQHSSKLTREGWLYERELLQDFLVNRKPPAQVRRESKHIVDNGKRTFKIKSRDGLPVIPQIDWMKTILDVRMHSPEEYCKDVLAWATATLRDSEHVEI